jgi:hypothetical protein
MSIAFAFISFGLGLAYLALAGLVMVEVHQERRSRGVSRFGLAYVGMALSCGPHHFIHGTQALHGFNFNWIVMVSVLAGLPGAVVFVGLRIEAMLGGRGDRHVLGTPPWLVAAGLGFCFLAGALVAAAAFRLAGGHRPALLVVVPNAFVAVTYAAVGLLLLRTQYLRRGALGGWSLSGVSLSMIFPTCALMHLVYALTAVGDFNICPADLFGVPASAYFLWVVHRLYRQALVDWNRRPIVGPRQATRRPAPWEAPRAAGWRPDLEGAVAATEAA